MTGSELFETIVQSSGLPEGYVRGRLSDLIEKKGSTVESLTVDQMRDILSELLLDLIQESADEPKAV